MNIKNHFDALIADFNAEADSIGRQPEHKRNRELQIFYRFAAKTLSGIQKVSSMIDVLDLQSTELSYETAWLEKMSEIAAELEEDGGIVGRVVHEELVPGWKLELIEYNESLKKPYHPRDLMRDYGLKESDFF